jgi:hypothetical protein
MVRVLQGAASAEDGNGAKIRIGVEACLRDSWCGQRGAVRAIRCWRPPGAFCERADSAPVPKPERDASCGQRALGRNARMVESVQHVECRGERGATPGGGHVAHEAVVCRSRSAPLAAPRRLAGRVSPSGSSPMAQPTAARFTRRRIWSPSGCLRCSSSARTATECTLLRADAPRGTRPWYAAGAGRARRGVLLSFAPASPRAVLSDARRIVSPAETCWQQRNDARAR